jgi:glutamate synthase (NADPH) large chain
LQICGLVRDENRQEGESASSTSRWIEERAMPEAHVCSLSLDSVIYKLRGTPDLLIRVYPDLQNP